MRRIGCLLLVLLLVGCASPSDDEKQAQAIDKSTFLRLADRAYAGRDIVLAASMYQKAIAEDPNLIPARIGFAKTLADMGNIPAAIEAYNDLLKLKPDDIAAKRNLAMLYLGDFKAEQAEKLLIDALNQKPDSKLFNSLGVAYDIMGRPDNAKQAYYSGLSIGAADQNILANLGLSLALNGDVKKGAQIMQKAVNSPESNPVYRQNLALIYILSGQRDLAEKMLRLDLNDTEVTKIVAFYDRVAAMESSSDRIKSLMRGLR